MRTRVLAEWHALRYALIHRPGAEMFFGLLAPSLFLYERAFSIDEALYQHQNFEHVLSRSGVEVRRLKRAILEGAKQSPDPFKEARKSAYALVKFEGSGAETSRARREFRKNVALFDPETIFNILLLRPTVKIGRGGPRISLSNPLANLLFMRDQQAVTDRGVVLGRMARAQRRMETLLTSTMLRLIDAQVIYRVRPPGTFEGGDFIPAGEFALVGTGDRTNRNGVNQLLRNALGFKEVAVVHQPVHPLIPAEQRDPMINMHLDTYLNFAGEGIAVGCTPLLKGARTEVYRMARQGAYAKQPWVTNVFDYLTEKGFAIVEITTLEQLCYAANFLCVKDRSIIGIETEKVAEKVLRNLAFKTASYPDLYRGLNDRAKRDIGKLRQTAQFFPHKKEFHDLGVDVTPIMLDEITGGYGGARCMTCVLDREP